MILPTLLLVLLGVAAPAQGTGRTMQLLAPAVLGRTAAFGVTHPTTAAGNLYQFLWCMPQFAGTLPLVVPGFGVQGTLRVDPATSMGAFAGVFGAGGSVVHSLAIPSHPAFVGVAWDLQSIDLEPATATLTLADDELSITIADGPLAALNMVAIAPGTFAMGSPVQPLGVAPYYNTAVSQPVHQVTISRPFWIGRYEVTQAEYQALMGSNPSRFGPAYANHLSRPVERVTWNQAMAYCAALTAREAAAGRLPSGYEYRLPTEAEWEYCCRAGTTTEFHTGAALPCGVANFRFSYHTSMSCWQGQTVPVGSHAPNAWGLHDMHGNVAEWCLDRWDGSANHPAGAVVDPFGQVGGDRVFRGGSWSYDSDVCRSAARYPRAPGAADENDGFRVVCAPVR